MEKQLNKFRELQKKFSKIKEKFNKEQIKYCDEYSKIFVDDFYNLKEHYNFYAPHILNKSISEMESCSHTVYDTDEPCVNIIIKYNDNVIYTRRVKIYEISKRKKKSNG